MMEDKSILSLVPYHKRTPFNIKKKSWPNSYFDKEIISYLGNPVLN
jgi:hypothetical protein